MGFLYAFFKLYKRLHIFYFWWHIIKCRVPINLVFCGVKKSPRILGIGRVDMPGFYYPNTDPLHSTCINVPGVFNGHFFIRSMQTANMFVIQTLPTPNKNLPEWPFLLFHFPLYYANLRSEERRVGKECI